MRTKRAKERTMIGGDNGPDASGSKLSRADALSYLKRFPAQGRVAVAINIALVLAGNSLVLWLLLTGRFRAAHLIALVMVESVLLASVAWALHWLVPRRDWLEQPKPWREQLPVFAFMLVWIGGAYGMTLLMIRGYGDFLALLRSPDAWFAAGLHWPLAYTLLLAIVHAAGDYRYYRRNGGPFHSSVSQDAMARMLTLVLGGIPFAMPFFAATIGGFKGIEFIAKKAKVSPERSVLAGVAMLIVTMGSFGVISLLVSNEVAGWAIGYVFAKLIAEVLIACIPLVMVHVASESTEAVKSAAPRGASS